MRRILIYFIFVFLILNSRSQISSLDSLRLVYPSVASGFYGIEGNELDLFATYGGNENVDVYQLPEYKMVRSYSLPCDITVDALFDNEKLYVLGYSYQADSLNFVIGLFDIKTQTNQIIARFSSKSSWNWSYNDLSWDLNKNIRIECSDSVHYYSRDLILLRKEFNPKLDSDYVKSPKLNCIDSMDDDFTEVNQFNLEINEYLNNEVEKTDRPFNCHYSIFPLFADTIICTSEGQIISTKNINVKKGNHYYSQLEPIKTEVSSFDEGFSKLIRLNQLCINERDYDLSSFSENFEVFYTRDNSILFKTDKAISNNLLKKNDLPFKVKRLKKNRLYFFNSDLGIIKLDKVRRFYDIINYRFVNNTIYILSTDGDLNIYSIGKRKISSDYFDIWKHFESNDQYHTLDLEIDEKRDLLQITTNIGALLEFDLQTLAPVDTIITSEMWSQGISNLNEDMYALESNGYNYYFRDRATDQDKFKLVYLDNKNTIITLSNSPYYMCSKEASKMLHYVSPSLKVISFDQLDPVYNRPDIVLDSLGRYFGGADQELIASYREAWEKRIQRLGLDKDMLAKREIAVPDAEIVNELEYNKTSGEVKLEIKAHDPKYELRRFNVLVNEVPVYGSNGISISHLHTKDWDTTINIRLTVGLNKLQVVVMNQLGLLNFKYPEYVNYTNNDVVSKTVFIGIGVNDFEDSKAKDLKYCVKDVKDLGEIFYTMGNTDTLLLTGSQVTKENIQSLKKYLLQNTNVNDRVIISCSSHGLLDNKNNFYLAMHNTNFSDPRIEGLLYAELEGLLDSIPARKKLLLLDACNSGENEILSKGEDDLVLLGGAENDTMARGIIMRRASEEQKSAFETMMGLFVNVQNETGTLVISAAGGKQNALEAIEVDGKVIQNGAFTFSVLEYLNSDNVLTVNGLKKYVENRVETITGGNQKPTSRQETMDINWELK